MKDSAICRCGWPSGLRSKFTVTCTNHSSLSPIRREFAPYIVPYKKVDFTGIASDKVCQLPFQRQRLSPGIPASSTNKTDHRDWTETLLKLALNPNQTNKLVSYDVFRCAFKHFLTTKCTEKYCVRMPTQKSTKLQLDHIPDIMLG